jgi:hypothetical protein
MDAHQLGIRHRHLEKLALNGLRAILAVVLSVLGCGLLFVPCVAEELAYGGYGPGFRFLLGASHLAGGTALLLPHLAERVALVFLLFGVCSRLRHRGDVAVRNEMLSRYADRADSRAPRG